MAGNQRVTQLIGLTAAEVEPIDLLYIVDMSGVESKKITLEELSSYLSISGSLFVFHAINADTASYILASNIVGFVSSSNFSLSSLSASWASMSFSSSYALTASFALNGGNTTSSLNTLSASWASQSLSSSYALNASTADVAGNSSTTNFLIYTGGNNGTASFAINANNSSNADTASYFNNTVGNVLSASYALNADTAAFVQNAVSASYAVQAGSVTGVLLGYGMTLATTQSLSTSLIDTVTVNSSLGIPQSTMIEAFGDCILSFTSSTQNSYSLSLYMIDRYTGVTSNLDTSIMGLNGNSPGNWDSPESGTITIPFSFVGQQPMYGNYLVEVTSSSPNLIISPNRITRFIFESNSDVLTTQADEPIQFIVTPTSSVLFTFYSTAGGPFTDYLPGLLQTGSQNILNINMSNQGVTDVRYTWELSNLTAFTCSNNPTLPALLYTFPSSLQTLVCNSCSLTSLPDLSNTIMSYLDCSANNLSSLPNLSISTSYLNFSYNLNITSFTIPPLFPNNLQVLYAQSTSLTFIPSLPDSITTASFSNAPITDIDIILLPFSLSYFDISNTFVSQITVPLPISLSYLNLESASFTISTLENVTNGLVSNGYLSGTLNIQSYGPPGTFSPTLIFNIGELQSNDWTVLTD